MKETRSLKKGRLRHVDTLRGDDPEARALKAVDDLAGDVAPGRVRLDDREGPFEGHAQLSQIVQVEDLARFIAGPDDGGNRRC
jgi:hypothetical protein